MAEQLRMPWGGGPRRPDSGTGEPAAHGPGRARRGAGSGTPASVEHRRHRPPANRPVRGEPDLPEAPPRRGDWRIDQRTRLAGLRGVARARAALGATGPEGSAGDQVDAA